MAYPTTTRLPDDPSSYLLLDVLPRERFEQVHIPGARNACVYEVTFLDQVRALNPAPETTLLIYGDSETSYEASIAVDKLARAGYRHLVLLEGGLQAWAARGGPLEGENPEGLAAHPDLSLPEGRYRVDAEKSLVGWTGRNANGRHVGTLAIEHGELLAGASDIQGRFVIDLHSLRNLDLEGNPLKEVLIKHLLSDDFFWAERFPKITFILISAHPIPGSGETHPNIHLRGELEMRGVTAPFDFAATLSRSDAGAWQAEAHFDLDRTRWEILYGSSRFFAHLGKHKVFDHVSLEIALFLLAG